MPPHVNHPKLRAVLELDLPSAREDSGRHEYDGHVQDLSPDGVRAGLHCLRAVEEDPLPDEHDEAQLAAAERRAEVLLGDLEMHRVDPLWHVRNLDLSGYDRPYAPDEERRRARDQHLALWPDVVAGAVSALDRVPGPVAAAALPSVRGLADSLLPQEDEARDALARLLDHVGRIATTDHAEPAMGAAAFARLLSATEACSVDLERLATRAEVESERLQEQLQHYAGQLDATASVTDVLERLRARHPRAAELADVTRDLVDEVVAWTDQSGLVPHADGAVEVHRTPESQRMSAAGMFGAAPAEADIPSRFFVSPPAAHLSPAEQRVWLASFFNPATLPVIAVHEVVPGHHAHFRAWRRVEGEARRTLTSYGFVEGWAHYAEQLAFEEGFRSDDPAFGVGISLDGLRRATRLRASIGLHTGELDANQAAALFQRHAHVEGAGALAEAERGLVDPFYGGYTWGRLELLDLRERARARWGTGFSLARFHRALLDLGSPPLGLAATALERG